MTPELAAGIVFAVGAVALVVIFVVVAVTARGSAVPYDDVTRPGYRIRRLWFGVLIVVALGTLAATLTHVPYPGVRSGRQTGTPMLVQVVASQWSWEVTPPTLPAGRPLRFEVTSKDVNHGFGIFDSGDHLVGTVQAMPGYTNVLYLTFDKPGIYAIRCLELCGLFHHAMVLPNLEVVGG
jgi:cytochrome c oxidase subunit II